MTFSLDRSVQILERTPSVLRALLNGLSDDWIRSNEGPDTWSPYDVVGHLIHGETTDWIARLEIILSDGDKRFTPFDRFAQFRESQGKSMQNLLDEFEAARKRNLVILRSKNLDAQDFNRTGVHPAFGDVTLENLLATWVAHDLNHIAQIARVMASQYKMNVGPWVEYLRILKS